ncbi:unnamed protein product [Sphagnum jensenii]|uniref:Uncharacterized protein n=1 Tax=Sphagnum jensenii TaxID=128206 RepID=A0ABP1A2N4_9BRYO
METGNKGGQLTSLEDMPISELDGVEESTAANNQPGGALSESGRRNQRVERAAPKRHRQEFSRTRSKHLKCSWKRESADTDGAFEDLETMILSLDSSSAIWYRRSWNHAVLY